MNNEIITLYMTMLVYIYLIKMMSTTEMTKDKNHQKNQKHHMFFAGNKIGIVTSWRFNIQHLSTSPSQKISFMDDNRKTKKKEDHKVDKQEISRVSRSSRHNILAKISVNIMQSHIF